MPPPRIDRYLQSGEHLQPLVAKALEISALSKSCLEILPPELTPHVQGVNIREDMLVIHAANPAAAAKLKLLAGTLTESLLKQGSKVKGVSVRVQPAAIQKSYAASHKRASISPDALTKLRELRDSLAQGPARQALERLLEARQADVSGGVKHPLAKKQE